MPASASWRRSASRRLRPCVLGAMALLLTGCDLLIPIAILSDPKQKVPAEFDKLEGKRAAIVVWAPQETLFDYPYVRMELGLHIADKISAELKDVEFVDGRKIEDFVERKVSTAIDPEEIGRQFDCDMVVYLELLEFNIRDPEAPDFLRARIQASVTVYDMRSDAVEPQRYPLNEVTAVYPENQPVLFNNTTAAVVRKEAYEKFAEMVARKFYEHEVEMM